MGDGERASGIPANRPAPWHSDKEGAEANFKGHGHHPPLMFCDNTE
ncbi:hypothetical protein [Streptomyces pacificus]|nr:hypothetical protein [Streptomyces pacificus]